MTPQPSPLSLEQQAAQNLINDDQFIAANLNRIALTNFEHDCQNWLAENMQIRANGGTPTVKPNQPPALHVTSVLLADGSAVNISFVGGPDLLGSPCPDLPPAILSPGNFKLGVQVTGIPGAPVPGNEFAAGIADDVAIGTRVTDPATGHTYVKISWGPFSAPNSDGSIPGLYVMLS